MMILRALTSAGDSATIADRKSKSDGLMMEAESGCRNNLSHKKHTNPDFSPGFVSFTFVFDIRNSCENIEYETVGNPSKDELRGVPLCKEAMNERGILRER